MSGKFVYALLQIAILLGETCGQLSECPDGLKSHRQKNWRTEECCSVVICEPGYEPVPCHSGTKSICRRCKTTDYQNTSCLSTNQFCVCQVRRQCEHGKLIREGDTTRANECSTGIPNGHLKILENLTIEALTLSQKGRNSIFSTHPSALARPTTTLSTTTSLPTPNEPPWGIVVVAVFSVLVVAGLIVIAVIYWKSKRDLRDSSSNREPLHVVINNNCDGRNKNNNEVENPLN